MTNRILTREDLIKSILSANTRFVGGSWMYSPRQRAEAVSVEAWEEIDMLRSALRLMCSSRISKKKRKIIEKALYNTDIE